MAGLSDMLGDVYGEDDGDDGEGDALTLDELLSEDYARRQDADLGTAVEASSPIADVDPPAFEPEIDVPSLDDLPPLPEPPAAPDLIDPLGEAAAAIEAIVPEPDIETDPETTETADDEDEIDALFNAADNSGIGASVFTELNASAPDESEEIFSDVEAVLQPVGATGWMRNDDDILPGKRR